MALDEHEALLLRVRSGPEQLARLTKWAKSWPALTAAARTGLHDVDGFCLKQLLEHNPGCRRSRQSQGTGRTAALIRA